MKYMISLVFLSACGRDLDRLPSVDLVQAERIALSAIKKHVGEKAYAYLTTTANIEVTAVPGSTGVPCGDADAVEGCAHWEPEGESTITVAGDPRTCKFIAVLTHEYMHIWLRAIRVPDHDHNAPEWDQAWAAYDEVIADKDGLCE